MAIKLCIVKKMNYEAKSTENISIIKEILQELSVNVGVFDENKKLDIKFCINASTNEKKELFQLDVSYRVVLSSVLKNPNKKKIAEIVKELYPNFKNFVKDFYNKQAGLNNLEPPEF